MGSIYIPEGKKVLKESRITSVTKQTENRFLNMYELGTRYRDGSEGRYFLASRCEDPEDLKYAKPRAERQSEAVMIFAVMDDRLVLEHQYRYPIDDYIYEFPAGLMEPGEDALETGVREFFEETGLVFTPYAECPSVQPFYISPGMTDESLITVFGTASGTPTVSNEEKTEDIQIVLADRDECRRILREENVSIMCAWLLMHYIRSKKETPFDFLP